MGDARRLPRNLKQFLDQPRRGDDRWAAVKCEAVTAIDRRSATWLIAFLQERDSVPARCESHRGGEPAESAADHDDRSGRR